MPLFDFFSKNKKKKSKSKSTRNLASIGDELPQHHSSTVGHRVYGDEQLPAFYRSTKERRYPKGPKSCPIELDSSPVTSRRSSSRNRTIRTQSSESSVEEYVQIDTLESFRQQLRQAEEEKMILFKKCERITEWRNTLKSDRKRDRDIRAALELEHRSLLEENENLRRQLEMRREMEQRRRGMQQFPAPMQPSPSQYVSTADFQHVQNELRHLQQQMGVSRPSPFAFTSPFGFNPPSWLPHTPASDMGVVARPGSEDFERQFGSPTE